MTQDRFLELLTSLARDESVRNVLAQLARPSGRRPDTRVIETSRWFNGLTADDRGQLHRMMLLVADASLRAVIEVLNRECDRPVPGHFELEYVDPAGTSHTLAGPGLSPLGAR